MANIEKLRYSRQEIDEVGEKIRQGLKVSDRYLFESILVPDLFNARDKIHNWRAVHNHTMETVKAQLRQSALAINSEATVVSRLKRFPTIVDKLARHNHFKLTEMQDIGGCRVVFNSMEEVNEFVGQIKSGLDDNKFEWKKDYISKPKPDSGYRSFHIIYSFESTANEHAELRGLRTEVQVRTHTQHTWATAVEIIDHHKAMSLKFGQGSKDWERLFLLMSAYLANRENLPRPSTIPHSETGLKNEIRELYKKTNAGYWLNLAPRVFDSLFDESGENEIHIIKLVPDTTLAYVHSFKTVEIDQAIERYNFLEMEKGSDRNIVLATASTLKELREAFPNYVLDSTAFYGLVQEAIA